MGDEIYYDLYNMNKLFLIVFVFVLKISLFSQCNDTTPNASPYKYLLNLGHWFNRDGTIFEGDYSFSLGNNFYKVGYFLNGGFSPFGNEHPGMGKYYFRSLNISIGKRLQSEWFEVSGFCGPSYVYGRKGTNFDIDEKFNTLGLSGQIQLLLRLANEIGIGFGLLGNLNSTENFEAIFINLTIGNGK